MLNLPADPRAEIDLLVLLHNWPAHIASIDAGPYLTDWKRREVWRAMQAAYARTWDASPARFSHFLQVEMAERYVLWEELYRGWRPDCPDVYRLLERLQRCTEARRLIAAAQEIAERAWRVPERDFGASDAQRVLDRALGGHDNGRISRSVAAAVVEV